MKVVVAHPHQQHSYRLAAAVKEAGHDLIYITTVYNRPHSLTKLVSKLLKGGEQEKARGRRTDAIDDAEVHQFCELGGLIVLLLFRIDRSKKIYNYMYSKVRKRFGIKAARYAHKVGADVFIGYDACSLESFQWLKKHDEGITRVVDYSAVSLPYQAKYAFEDIESDNGNILPTRKRELLDPIASNYGYALEEMLLLDYAITASEFTKESLLYCGIGENRIFVAPYGFTDVGFRHVEGDGGVVTFAYCGRLTYAKGVHRLLSAYSEVANEETRLLLIGRYDNNDGYFDGCPASCEFTGPLLHREALSRLAGADVFVFPSLTDGMSLACMEAMSIGLPVVVSRSTGASQFVSDGINGFVVSASDEQALAHYMRALLDDQRMRSAMGVASAEVARSYGWDSYDRKIAAFLLSVEHVKERGGADDKS